MNLIKNINNETVKENDKCDECQHACTVYSYECVVCPYNYEHNGAKK